VALSSYTQIPYLDIFVNDFGVHQKKEHPMKPPKTTTLLAAAALRVTR